MANPEIFYVLCRDNAMQSFDYLVSVTIDEKGALHPVHASDFEIDNEIMQGEFARNLRTTPVQEFDIRIKDIGPFHGHYITMRDREQLIYMQSHIASYKKVTVMLTKRMNINA